MRFDMDYTIFETVKINSRCAFPLTLDMHPYTQAGIQAREATASAQAAGKPVDASVVEQLEIREDYRLQGILIHSGVAQGGHYYSLIKDREVEGQWFKFDDEDVTRFDPAHIEAECFGGTQTRTTTYHGTTTTSEIECNSNAFMLFYEKMSDDPCEDLATEEKKHCPYSKDVHQENLAFVKCAHLLDPELSNFTLNLLQNESSDPQLTMYGIEYIFDGFVHSRDEKNVRKELISAVNRRLEAEPESCDWFVKQLSCNRWLQPLFTECPSKVVQQLFSQVVIVAFDYLVRANIVDALESLAAAFVGILQNCPSSLFLDEFYTLVVDVAETYPLVCAALIRANIISHLVAIVTTEPPAPLDGQQAVEVSYRSLLEALSALVGVPRLDQESGSDNAIQIPDQDRALINGFAFQKKVVEQHPTASARLLLFCSQGSMDISEQLVKILVHTAVGSYFWSSRNQYSRNQQTGCGPHIEVLLSLLQVQDENHETCVNQALFGEYGILTYANARYQEGVAQSGQVVCWLILVALELYFKIPTAHALLDEKLEAWAWTVVWLQHASLEEALGGHRQSRRRHPTKLWALEELMKIHGVQLADPPVPPGMQGAEGGNWTGNNEPWDSADEGTIGDRTDDDEDDSDMEVESSA